MNYFCSMREIHYLCGRIIELFKLDSDISVIGNLIDKVKIPDREQVSAKKVARVLKTKKNIKRIPLL